jgi:predicted Fe-Mo cluster-binding NifX family protein
MSEEVKDVEVKEAEVKEAEVKETPKKKSFITESKLEILIAIFLGITMVLTAWATWIGSLHGGNQATNYTKSNNISSDANSMYNEAAQNVMQDMMLWNTITDYKFDMVLAEAKGEQTEVTLIEQKIDQIVADSCTESFQEAIEWALSQETEASPFDKEGYIDSYYEEANAKLSEAQALLEEGMQDNKNGDTYNLVTVIYSLVLFLLGIVGIFKNIPNRFVVFIIAVIILIIATVFMVQIPMPTGFDIGSYF